MCVFVYMYIGNLMCYALCVLYTLDEYHTGHLQSGVHLFGKFGHIRIGI